MEDTRLSRRGDIVEGVIIRRATLFYTSDIFPREKGREAGSRGLMETRCDFTRLGDLDLSPRDNSFYRL